MKIVKKAPPHFSRVMGYYLLGVITGLIGLVAMARIIWHSKFYPNVRVGSVRVGGMTREQAAAKIAETHKNMSLELVYNGYVWTIPGTYVEPLIEQSLNEAYRVGRRLNLSDYALIFVNKPQTYPLVLAEGTTDDYEKLVTEIAQSVEIPVETATLGLTNKEVTLTNGRDGLQIDVAELKNRVGTRVARLEPGKIDIPTRTISAQLREADVAKLVEVGRRLTDRALNITLDDGRTTLEGAELLSFLDTTPGAIALVDHARVTEYVEGLAKKYNRAAEDARFEFVEGRVTEFAPGKDGIAVEVEETVRRVEQGIKELAEGEEDKVAVQIVAARTPPPVTMDKINEYGIKERIGRGESYYAHSIPNRIYNVGLASSRINSALIAPGEEVSFNKLVGEVSAATGYRSAYIISQGRTVLGDGGGLCQVSTTLFRAAMSAGLPILERWGHSYRVSYYELNSKPGVDATVIAPSKDFRFKNDTPGHILIQTINDPKNLHLVIEIYGTSDGRVATMSEPKVWGITPPLPTIYEDDPSLPTGTVKQVDWAASGARASFEYKVTRNGETLQEQTFSTVYRPWASVFLRGTGN